MKKIFIVLLLLCCLIIGCKDNKKQKVSIFSEVTQTEKIVIYNYQILESEKEFVGVYIVDPNKIESFSSNIKKIEGYKVFDKLNNYTKSYEFKILNEIVTVTDKHIYYNNNKYEIDIDFSDYLTDVLYFNKSDLYEFSQLLDFSTFIINNESASYNFQSETEISNLKNYFSDFYYYEISKTSEETLFNIKVDETNIVVHNESTFTYNDKTYSLLFKSLDDSDYFNYLSDFFVEYSIGDIISLEEIDKIVITNNTIDKTTKLELNTSEKVNEFIQKIKDEKIKVIYSEISSDILFELKIDDNNVIVYSDKYVSINDSYYELENELSFLNDYNENNVDKVDTDSGFLPWV